jgi:hypothetical protein
MTSKIPQRYLLLVNILDGWNLERVCVKSLPLVQHHVPAIRGLESVETVAQ